MRPEKRGWDPRGPAARIGAAALLLLVWQGAAWALHNPLLLVGPWQVALRLGEMVGEGWFWRSLGATFGRVIGGFLLALVLAVVLSALAARFPLLETLLRPYVAVIRSVPVVSFIVIALLWLSSRRISAFIAFLMVFPGLYASLLQGIRSADRELLEMARVFRVPAMRRVQRIYLAAVREPLLSACAVALGLCWKAGVAAEVIAVAAGSVGGRLYDAKAYLEIADLFAWTAVIVAVSALFERLFVRLLGRALDAWERA